eukprot:gene32440-55040_t
MLMVPERSGNAHGEWPKLFIAARMARLIRIVRLGLAVYAFVSGVDLMHLPR